MKIRTSFVSNSSSSSFIMGIAKVPVSEVGLQKSSHVLKLGLTRDGWLDLPEPLQYKRLDDNKYRIFIESFTGSQVSVEAKIGDWIIWLDSYGPDGDGDFWDGHRYDYDVYLDDFFACDQEIYNEIIALKGQARYGAGRNG